MIGISSKFSRGGGDGIVHSIDLLPQGLAGAGSPLRADLNRLYSMINSPIVKTNAPIVDKKWPV